MSALMKRFTHFSSYITPITIEKFRSELNPYLEVTYSKGKYVLNARFANYSFGMLHEVFVTTFKKTKLQHRNIKEVLLLGFGAGSVASILTDNYKLDCHITAVEKDQLVIDIGEKYFNTNRYNNLELHCSDAAEFVTKDNMQYDLIVVDVFSDLDVPKELETKDFILALKSRLNPNGLVLFNKVVYNYSLKKQLPELKSLFESCFEKVSIYHTMGINRVIIAE